MVRGLLSAALVSVLVSGQSNVHAQNPQATDPAFDVVSIKRNTSPVGSGGGMRSLPDGTFGYGFPLKRP
jgi:hypothetical protein